MPRYVERKSAPGKAGFILNADIGDRKAQYPGGVWSSTGCVLLYELQEGLDPAQGSQRPIGRDPYTSARCFERIPLIISEPLGWTMIALLDDESQGCARVCRYDMGPDGDACLACQTVEDALHGILDPEIGGTRARERCGKVCVNLDPSGLLGDDGRPGHQGHCVGTRLGLSPEKWGQKGADCDQAGESGCRFFQSVAHSQGSA